MLKQVPIHLTNADLKTILTNDKLVVKTTRRTFFQGQPLQTVKVLAKAAEVSEILKAGSIHVEALHLNLKAEQCIHRPPKRPLFRRPLPFHHQNFYQSQNFPTPPPHPFLIKHINNLFNELSNQLTDSIR